MSWLIKHFQWINQNVQCNGRTVASRQLEAVLYILLINSLISAVYNLSLGHCTYTCIAVQLLNIKLSCLWLAHGMAD